MNIETLMKQNCKRESKPGRSLLGNDLSTECLDSYQDKLPQSPYFGENSFVGNVAVCDSVVFLQHVELT